MNKFRSMFESLLVDTWYVIKRAVLFVEYLYLAYLKLNQKFVEDKEMQRMAKWGMVLEIFLLG